MAPNVRDHDEQFYARLPEIERFVEVPQPDRYAAVPDTWCVIITDVRGSTRAIEEGRYKDVNTLGVASIVALRNALPDVDLPFVFGGDGATLLAPASRLAQIRAALRGVRRMAGKAFGLEMRVGIVPMGELRRAGHDVRVARYRISAHAALAMLAGDGVLAAERWIKDPDGGTRYSVDEGDDASASFDGFECRWQPVASRRGVIVTLLVHARGSDAGQKAETYRRVIERIEAVAPSDGGRPLAAESLRLARFTSSFAHEARVRSQKRGGWRHFLAALRARVMTLLGRLSLATGLKTSYFDGRRYRAEVVENTDHRKFDETLRMVLDLDQEQRAAVDRMLEEEQQAGRLFYGSHASPTALVTCMVGRYTGNHLHFVDGSNGGYALSAKQLKDRIRDAERTPGSPGVRATSGTRPLS